MSDCRPEPVIVTFVPDGPDDGVTTITSGGTKERVEAVVVVVAVVVTVIVVGTAFVAVVVETTVVGAITVVGEISI